VLRLGDWSPVFSCSIHSRPGYHDSRIDTTLLISRRRRSKKWMNEYVPAAKKGAIGRTAARH